MNEYIILHLYHENSTVLLLTKTLRRWELFCAEIPSDGTTVIFFPPGSYETKALLVKESPAEIESLIMGKPKLDIGRGPNQIHPDNYLLALFDMEKLKEENTSLKDQLNNTPYADLHSHMGRCIFSPIKSNRICEVCASKLEIVNNENEPTFSLREINALKDAMEKLKEENAKLKTLVAQLQPIKNWPLHINGENYEKDQLIEENAKLKEELSSYKTNLMRYELLHGNTNLHSNPSNPCCRETYEKLTESLFTVSRDDRLDLINWNESFRAAIQETKND